MEKKSRKGMEFGGWLLFFFIVFILGALGSLIGAGSQLVMPVIYESMVGSISENVGAPMMPFPALGLRIVAALLSLVIFVFELLAIIAIGGKKMIGKNYAIISVWIGVVYTIYYTIMSALTLPKMTEYLNSVATTQVSNIGFTIAGWVFGIVFGLAWAIVVTLYFVRSERVKKTLVR